MSINELQDEVIAEFSDFDDWMDRYQLLCAVLNQIANQFLQLGNKREKHHNGSHTENGVQKCDGYRSHDHIQKSKMNERIQGIEYNGPQDQTE